MGFFSDAFDAVFGGDDESKGFERAQGIIERVEVPELRSLILDLGELVEIGELTPTQADAVLQESTGYDDIALDPELQRAQYQTLQRLSEVADADGLDARSMSRLREAQAIEDQRLQGDIGAIEQREARRGEMTSNADFVNNLIAAQSSANRMADQGFDAAALAEQNAMDASMARANLAGGMESAQYGREADKARARDAISQFNVRQRQAVEDANVNRENAAEQYNLDRELGRQKFNIGQRGLEEQSRVGAIESDFERRFSKARDAAGIRTGRGTAQQSEAERRRGNVGSVIGGNADGIIGAVKGIASMFSDPDVKENVYPIDLDEFLDEIDGYEYNYKGDDEQQFGVMSDDLKKSEYGRSLVDDSGEFDKVNYAKAVPGMLASIAELNKRVKKVENK